MIINKKKIKYVIICILLSLISGMIVYITELYISHPVSLKLLQPCVPDEDTAISLAQTACKSYLDIDIEKEAFIAVHGKDVFGDGWQVRLKNKYDFNKELYKNHIVSDDSGVFINSQDGTIQLFMISDDSINEYYELKNMYQ